MSYSREVLAGHVLDVMAKLLAVRVAFSYSPGTHARHGRITLDDRHAPTLAAILRQLNERPG